MSSSPNHTHGVAKTARLQLRLQESLKQRIESVARAKGLTATDYALAVLAEKANEDFERQTSIVIGPEDREAFFALLDDERPLGAAWRRAADQAKKLD